ncbi:MAG: hypothetical protein Q8P36_02840 [bacterium]|nr:hypothetical protein [bacterium]
MVEANQIAVADTAVGDAVAEPAELSPVEGIVVAIVRQHVVTIRVDIDGKPVEASFFIEDLSQDTGHAFIKNSAPVVLVRSCTPETPPKLVVLPHAVVERIRTRLARLT